MKLCYNAGMNSFHEKGGQNSKTNSVQSDKCGHRNTVTQDTQRPRNPDTKDTHETFSKVLDDLLPDIEKLVPLDAHQIMGCYFPLARIARTFERRIGHAVSMNQLESIFEAWYAYCENTDIMTEDDDESDYFASFVAIYGSTKVPHYEGIMERALEAAKHSANPPGLEKLRKKNPDITLIASLCHQLHLLNPHGHFFLSVRKVEELIPHLKRQKINHIIRYLCASEFIEEIQKGSLSGRQASTFKYSGDKANKEELGSFFKNLKESLSH